MDTVFLNINKYKSRVASFSSCCLYNDKPDFYSHQNIIQMISRTKLEHSILFTFWKVLRNYLSMT